MTSLKLCSGFLFLVTGLIITSALFAQDRETFSFALVTDTHINKDLKTPSIDLKRTIDDINRNPDIKFVVLTGDITEFGADVEFLKADSILQKLSKPWHVIPGNHDANWSESGTNSFKQIFGNTRFSFTEYGILFIGCASGPNMSMSPGLVPHEDVVWLRKKIEHTDDNKPVFFFNHYPVNKSLANWYLIIDELKKVNTQVIINGHGHRNKAFNYEGIPGTMGRSNLRAGKKTGGYNIVTVTTDSIIFRERNPGIKTQKPWRTIALRNHHFTKDTASYSRPSYKINKQYANVHTVWREEDKSDIGTHIISKRGLAIYANTAGYLMARNIKTGTLTWKFKTAGKIYSTPATKNSNVIFASTDSTIYDINLPDGTLRWKLKTKKSIVASPVISGDTVYIGSSEGVFRALSLKNGTAYWTNKDINGFVVTRPLVDEKHIYFGTWANIFYALDKETGKVDWQWSGGKTNRMYSPASVYPVKADNKIFITAPDRYTTCIDARSGEVLWRSNKHKGRESIGISPDHKLVYTKAMHDSLFAYSTQADSMDLAWSVNAGFGYEISPSPITEEHGIIYIPTDDGRIFAIDQKQRKVLWIHKISNAMVNYVYPLSDDEVLATTMDGKIVRLSYSGS